MVERPKEKPQTEAILADNSELGLDGVLALPGRLERYHEAHQRAMRMAHYAMELGQSKIALKLKYCGHWLVFRHYFTVDKVKLRAGNFCQKHLICPLCAIRRANKFLKAYMHKVEQLRVSDPSLNAYMVTLTVKDGEHLPERILHLRNAMRRMTQARRDYLKAPLKNRYVEFSKALGGVYSVEIKRGSNSALWHPHVHMIWLSYDEPDRYKLSKEWHNWTGDSFIVDVTPFHDQDNIVSGFQEVFKYALKFSELTPEDNWEAYKFLSSKRLVDSFGLLRGIVVSEDLTDEPLDDLPFIEMVYLWMMRSGYSLYSVSKPTFPSHQHTGQLLRESA